MTAFAVLALATAFLIWPHRSALRLAGLRPPRPRPGPRVARLLIALPAVVATLFAGLGGLLATTALTLTLRRQQRRKQRARARLHTTTVQADTLNLLVTQLRTGTHPAAAVAAVAADADPAVAADLAALATAARLGTEPAGPPSRLIRAWRTAQRHGVPLADLLDAQRRDLEQRARFTTLVEARLAGPRATAAVLALLPVLAVGLGEAMNADPLRTLTSSAPGQALLVVGVALICAGLEWNTRLTNKVAAA